MGTCYLSKPHGCHVLLLPACTQAMLSLLCPSLVIYKCDPCFDPKTHLDRHPSYNQTGTGQPKLTSSSFLTFSLLHCPSLSSAKELTDVKGNKYEFRVCEGVSGQASDVGMVMMRSGDKPVVLGNNSRALVSSQDNWLMLTLLGGDNYTSSCNKEERKAHIMFVCDRMQAELEIHTVEMLNISTSCYLLFVAGHKSICAPTPASGLSGGSIFLIIVLVTFCAYFTFGFFYLRLVRGAKGIEQIPNREFWFTVGNKLADGCGAVCRCDQYCGAGRPPSSYDGYSPIEERLAQDLQNTDRDSALLSP
nr:cation-dependent mannose-6-phosphate receptor-like [Penaeus vannamei]